MIEFTAVIHNANWFTNTDLAKLTAVVRGHFVTEWDYLLNDEEVRAFQKGYPVIVTTKAAGTVPLRLKIDRR